MDTSEPGARTYGNVDGAIIVNAGLSITGKGILKETLPVFVRRKLLTDEESSQSSTSGNSNSATAAENAASSTCCSKAM